MSIMTVERTGIRVAPARHLRLVADRSVMDAGLTLGVDDRAPAGPVPGGGAVDVTRIPWGPARQALLRRGVRPAPPQVSGCVDADTTDRPGGPVDGADLVGDGTPAMGASQPRLRITRRGRLVVTALAVLLAVALVVTAYALRSAPASAVVRPVQPVEQITVLPGQTLWGIAAPRAAAGDVRDVIAQIRELNGLTDSRILAGQELLVPKG